VNGAHLCGGSSAVRPIRQSVTLDFDFHAYSDEDLLRLWKRIPEVLRGRGVCRTKNVVSDVAERLVADKLGLTLAPNSNRDYDAIDGDGKRYQVKARMLSAWNGSTQLGDIHHLNEPSPFDFLIAVLFNDNFPQIHAGYLIPLAVVRQFARKKSNRDVLIARGAVLTAPGVEDITEKLAS
jgi:hypothetical protein